MKLSCNFDFDMKPMKMIKSFIPAFVGLVFLIKNENNLKFQLVLFFVVIFSGAILDLNRYDWICILLISAVVFVAEGLNSAIEKLADMVDLNYNPQIKTIKDISAAAVLIAALISIIVGLLIFYPHIKKLFFCT
jgi:diacylglycerol kinase (ATP)